MSDALKSTLKDISALAGRNVGFLIAVPLTALPERYRRRLVDASETELVGPAAVSGFVQLSVFGSLYIALFFLASDYMLVPIVEHMVDPRKLPIAYLTLEGAVRFLAAAFVGEVVPTLPLVLVAYILDRRDQTVAARKAGPPVRDRVTHGDGKNYDWCVESWGPKIDWDRNPYIMIAFRGQFYEVVGKERREPPRPHVYLLKKPPDWKLVVRPVSYDPDETKP